MSTFPHIQPMAGADPLEKGHGGENFSDATEGLAGLFEDVMARALSPLPNNSNPPNGQNQQSQITTQNVEIPNVFHNKLPAQTICLKNVNCDSAVTETIVSDFQAQPEALQSNIAASVKSPAKPANHSSNANKTSQAPAETVTGNAPAAPEAIVNQIFAATIPAAGPMVNLIVETARNASSAPCTSESTVIPVNLPQTKQVPIAAAKISASDLIENQTTAAAQAPVAPTNGSLTDKEAGLPTKDPEVSTPIDQVATDMAKANFNFESKNPSCNEPYPGLGVVVQPQADSNGTSIAKQDMSMQQVEKTNKIAGQTEKVLPSAAISENRGNASLISSQAEQLTTTTVGSPTLSYTGSGTLSPVDSSAVSVGSAPDTRILERTQDMVTLNAMRLSDSGNSSMQVVIKPDAGTQLSLELRQHGNSVEVQAVLQQGDFHHLSQQWPDLQQRLDQRGIRLAPLADDGSSANGGGNDTYQQQQNQTNNPLPDLALVDTPAGMFAPETAQAPVYRGWETWA